MKPILFNTAMVQATLDGRKTVTRRVIKPQPLRQDGGPYLIVPKKPYQVGDILYVRETWGDYEGKTNYYIYKADYPDGAKTYKFEKVDEFGEEIICDLPKWRPSIHMPKEAARIFLRVTGARAERLQDITEEEAIKEGLKAYGQNNCSGTSARIAFAELWDSTLPPNKNKFKCPENEWRSNPWVWVIEFERISKEDAKKE